MGRPKKPPPKPEPPEPRTLTSKQRQFVAFYLGEANGNATEAARMAGYSNAEIGRQLLRNITIRAAIDAKLSESALTASQILARLSEQAEGDIGEFLKVDRRGVVRLDFAGAKAAGKLHLVKSFRMTKDGWSFELYNAQAALELLGKFRKLFDGAGGSTGPERGKRLREFLDDSGDDAGGGA